MKNLRKHQKDLELEWRCHTGNLLKEILNCNKLGILSAPIRIFASLLEEVGKRASELNDPELNVLMCRLTIYSMADPLSDDYNKKELDSILDAAKKIKENGKELK